MKKIIFIMTLFMGLVIFTGCGATIKEDSSSIITTTSTKEGTIELDLSRLDSYSTIEDSSIKEDSSTTSKITTTSKTTTSKTSKTTTSKTKTTVTSIITESTVAAAPAIEQEEEAKTVATTTTKKVYEQKEATSQIEEYVVYKPSTHYIHKSTCRWVTSECYEISDTNGIEVRKCSECNPDMEIITEYKEPTTTTTKTSSSSSIDSYSRQLLAEIVWHEAGSDYISQYEKARIAAGVMNRVRDSRFPNTVYGVLTQKGQFSGYWPGSCTPTQACYDAVDYYFAHTSEFGNENSWYGDGRSNHFYYQ
jgi:hypothetical protein